MSPSNTRGGTHPYATGGGGFTLERKVAVRYLAHLLLGHNAPEYGDSRRVVSVGFQQSPLFPVDDLVVTAEYPDELQPSLVLQIAVRRSPKLVQSDESSRQLIRQFVAAITALPPHGPDHRFGLVVAGHQRPAAELAEVAAIAAGQIDAPAFFDQIQMPDRVNSRLRGRLEQFQKLVEFGLHDLDLDVGLVQRFTWKLLSRLTVQMPRLEPPDETDWSDLTNALTHVARDSDLSTASQLRDRLAVLAAEYAPRAANVDLTILRRYCHGLLDSTIRRHQHAWQMLDGIHRQACDSLHAEITAGDSGRSLCLDRNPALGELLRIISDADWVIVSGESGVGKSALVLLGLTAQGEKEPEGFQALCINLRQLPTLVLDLEAALGHPFSTLLSELSAPRRVLVIDAADAAAEDGDDVYRYLLRAARESAVQVVAVTSIDSKQVVLDALQEFSENPVADHLVPLLSDSEVDEVVATFSELDRVSADPRSRELLRRLVVVDLLVRGRVSGIPLTEADAMNEVWSGLVRRQGRSDRGQPIARQTVLLQLAALDLDESERLQVIQGFNSAAVDGLCRDGLLRTPSEEQFTVGPEFAHDEIRRYAIARLLLMDGNPATRLLQAVAPRWTLSASRLASQAWLAQPDSAAVPLKGRFDALQSSFDALVRAGHGERWADVPGEALLTLAAPQAILRDAWPGLLVDHHAGLQRLARLVHQRLRRKDGFVDVEVLAPIIELLLEDPAPWRIGNFAEDLLRDWLHGHVVARSAPGQPLRIVLRERLVEECATGDRRLADRREAAAAALLTPEEVEHRRQLAEMPVSRSMEIRSGHRRRRRAVPSEITDPVVLELLALLGPDLGDEGVAILRRVAMDAPSELGPCVDEVLPAQALTSIRKGFLAELTEAYYLDEESEPGDSDLFRDGVRPHFRRSIYVPDYAWHSGPFMPLFRTDFRGGVRSLNRLLNHAARIRSRRLEDLSLHRTSLPFDTGPYEVELGITGQRQSYVGDQHVWRWYRGNAVGPNLCFSALLALERVCDQLIAVGGPIATIVSILLDGCENLAMVGFVVGLLVRHLENAEDLLDPYLTEPFAWEQEFVRVVHESGGLSAPSEHLVAPERRKWSLQDAAMFMVTTADEERRRVLRTLGDRLVANARRRLDSVRDGNDSEKEPRAELAESDPVVHARKWASALDPDNYQVHATERGFNIEVSPPDDVAELLRGTDADLERAHDTTRLVLLYGRDSISGLYRAVSHDELEADLAIVQQLLENPPSLAVYDPSETSAMVAAVALEAHFVEGAALSDDAVVFAAEIVLDIGETDFGSRPFEFEGTFNEHAPDRSAARALPLLLLPAASSLRVRLSDDDQPTALDRAVAAGLHLGQAVADEVRLHLARGLDHVWKAPCSDQGPCHHDLGLQLATETIRRSLVGPWDPATGRRVAVDLDEPFAESLARADDSSIRVSRLDAAIRALAPAVIAENCVSSRARDLLLVLLNAQHRALLAYPHDRDPDQRGTHSLVSARALLTLAEGGDDRPLYAHIDAFADHSTLLEHLLRALSVAAEETPQRALTAKRLWPSVVRHVLDLRDSGHSPFADSYFGELALAALIPNPASDICFLYREVRDTPIAWWDPQGLASEIEAWLDFAAGNSMCLDRLLSFISGLETDVQVRLGLPWVVRLVDGHAGRIARGSSVVPAWLIDVRSAALAAGLRADWQRIVDVLVVAGAPRLAPYSE